MAESRIKVVIEAVSNVDKALGNATKGFKRFNENVREVGTGLMGLGAAPTAGLLGAAKAAINFETAFAGVRKTVDASEAEFKQIEHNFRTIATQGPISANELARIGELAGQLGVRGVDNITDFTQVMGNMAVATNMTSEAAALSFARIANIMQEPIENVDAMGASIVDLGNNFAAMESDIATFAERIAGAGKIAGLTTSDIFAIGTAMSSVGVEAEAGGTAVQKVLIAMSQAASGAVEDAGAFADVLGVTNKEFQTMFQNDPTAVFTGFVNALGEIAKEGGDAAGTLKDLELGDMRLVRAFLSLANAGDLVNKTVQTSTEAWKENTALTTEVAKRNKTVQAQLDTLRNNLTEVGLVLGETLLPMLNDAISAFKEWLPKIQEFVSGNPKLISGILAFGTALGVIGTVITALSFTVIPGIVSILKILGGAFTVIKVVVGGLVAVLGGPLTLIVLAVTAVIAGLYLAWQNNWFNIQEVTATVINTIVTTFNWLVETVTYFFTNFPTIVDTFLNTAWERIKKFFIEDIPWALGFALGWWFKFTTVDVPNFTMEMIKWLAKEIPKMVANFIKWIVELYKNTVANVEQMYTDFTNWIDQLVKDSIAFVEELPQKIPEIMERLRVGAVNKAKEIYEGVKQWFEKIAGFFDSIISKAREAFGAASDAAAAGFQAGVSRQTGGIVPGPVGAAVPITAHAGERIIPQGLDSPNGGGGGGATFNVTIGLYAGSETEKRNIARELYGALLTVAQSQNKSVSELMGG